jgi:hypothetical protein
MDGPSTLEAGEHLVILLATAILLVGGLRTRIGATPRATYLLIGAIAGLPVLLGVLPGTVEHMITGKEGLLEALTAGVLLALVVLGTRARSPWVLLGAGLLLLEELDYGQVWLGFGSPAALEEAGSSSGNFNSHNLPVFEALWRVVPLVAVVALATRERWPVALTLLADKVRLPRLDPGLLPGLAMLAVGVVATWRLAGEGRADEAGELAIVALVAVSWWSAETSK